MKRSILIGALALLAGSAYGANNLPAVCSNSAAEGQPLSSCATSAQTFSAATPGSLVRACSSASCPYADRTWRKMSDITSAQFVEVCTSDKAEGAAMNDCQGTTTSTWGAMAMVPPSQVARAVEAEPSFPGTFTVTPSSGTAPVTVTLAWNVSFTGGTCTASGSWSGAKALSGSQTVTNLTANAAYTLTCSRPVRGSASLSWAAPTRNTDGSALTTLAGYRISYGRSASSLTHTIQVPSPTTVNYIVGNLDSNTWYFGVRAYTSTGVESDLSNVVSKLVASTTETRSATREVTVTPPPKPEPPVLQVVDNRVFNATPDYSLLAFRAGKQYGTVALGVRCIEAKPISGGWYAIPSSAVRWASTARTAYPVARCSVR